MVNLTGLTTPSGKPIMACEAAEKLREKFSSNGNAVNFIAQEGPQEQGLSSNVDILITGGNRGGGKANSYATPVVTPNGFKLMGELEIGDKMVTPWDGIQEVTNIYEQGVQRCYVFHFDDGTTSTVMPEHRFLVGKPGCEEYTVMTAKEILSHYKLGGQGMYALREGETEFYEIPLPPPVNFENGITMEKLPIHPHVLGMASAFGYYEFSKYGLGMGRYDRTMYKHLYAMGLFFKIVGKHGYATGIPDDARKKITSRRTKIPAFIPDEYMYADVESRISFVQGVFYMNAHSMRSHQCGSILYIKLPNKKYINQLAQMCRSLGWWANVIEERDALDGQSYWKMVLKATDERIPGRCVVKAKFANLKLIAPTPQSKDDIHGLRKKIVRINGASENLKCRCITVSGNDHLYMTDGYTINHNTFQLLMGALYDIDKSRFNAIIFRKEKDDLTNIIRDSQALYKGEGAYNRSKDDMTWYFNSGATLSLTYYAGAYKDFIDRFQGRQYAYLGIDEITQIDYPKFKYLQSINRNACGIKNRIIGTCNPDPTSWVRTFISWWIGDDGYPIPERDGKVRYVYMKGEDVNEAVWGDTREEVYEQCKDEIDRLWEHTWGNVNDTPAGYTPQRMFTKSVTFIRAELKYNKILVKSDPSYFANLAQQSDEQKARDLMGNWNFMSMGDDIIKMSDLQACFDNAHQTDDGVRYASCDVAFTGGDNCVLWLWIGHHVQDIFVCKLNSKDTCSAINAKLEEWGVTQKHFTYDLNGLGQTFKGFFPHAIPFNNIEAVKPKFKNIYDNIKSQCAYTFAEDILERRISFNKSILSRRFSGKHFKNRTLGDILMIERKCIRQDTDKQDKGWCLIKKAQMKTLVGDSPDFFESLLMRKIFDIKQPKMVVPSWAHNF